MATGKRYYWMKLKESFMTSDTIDYFMSLPNGANYVVLYQMLCLKTINTEGRFERKIGAVLIPYDVEKIRRDTKWFSADTIRVALNLYMQFGLIYTDENGVLVIANHKELVGSETDYALQKSNQRKKNSQNQALPGVDNVHANVPSNVHESVHTDIRDKSIDIRDKSLDIRDRDSFISDDNDETRGAENEIDSFLHMCGLAPDAYFGFSESVKKELSAVTRKLYKCFTRQQPSQSDETNVFNYIWENQSISNDRVKMLACAFKKASDAGHPGQWNYIYGILGDMAIKGITTGSGAEIYYESRKDDA